MSYEFDEIRFWNNESPDWWETIKMVPIKILDQDFGMKVPKEDLIEATANEEIKNPDDSSEDQQGIAKKVFELDNFKRKKDAVNDSGYSFVKFTKDYFKVKIFSNHFEYKDFSVTFAKGFLVISAEKHEEDKEGEVWRFFERRYMLPHDCYVGDSIEQTQTKKYDHGIRVRVMKISDKAGYRRIEGKPHCLRLGTSPFGSPGGGGRSPRGSDMSPRGSEKSPKKSEKSPKRHDKAPKESEKKLPTSKPVS